MHNCAIVTGAAGFIGSHIVDMLLDQGLEVIGLDDLSRGSMDNLECAIRSDRFLFTKTDLANYQETRLVVEDVIQKHSVDVIWHMAANSDIGAGIANPEIDLNRTFVTTFNILKVMRELSIPHLAFASSSAVYGDLSTRLSEDTGPLFPISSYGAMKLASEASISVAVESYLEKAWIFRFPNVIGSRSTHGVIFDFINKLRESSDVLEILGDGNQQKPYIHVSELLSAMSFIVSNASDSLNYFNIGPLDDGASVDFIADSVIERMAPDAKKSFTGGSKGWIGDIARFTYSLKKLENLGWKPTKSSTDAIITTIDELLRD